ncbi:ABC transporter permease [Salinispora arenicola]|uniref:ABC transporter permease n=1 Tax=Salinispora arenicola TaxID=168697 RepID=UPI00036654F5|nr:ABC transporter permease [Salinispora arenicola]
MANTAVADADSGLTGAQLAARHGLSVADTRPTLTAYARTLWSYRHFMTTYANAKVTASFSQARLGQVWQMLTPLTNAAVYYLIFGVILNTSRGIDNFIAYLCVGLFLFTFTSSTATGGISAITTNLGLVRALHFPRAALPFAITLTQLRHLLAAMVVLIGIVLATGEPITLEWLLAIPALLLLAVFSVGLALALARLGSKLTDLKQIMPFAMRTWMYGSGVLYSVHAFTDNLPALATTLIQLNPMLIYIELFRHALLEGAPVTSGVPRLLLLATAWALLVGVGGFIYFWRGEQEYGRG